MDIRIKDRRLLQVALAYLAGGWLCLEAVSELSDQYGWPGAAFDITLTLLIAGFLAALVIGWFHGEKGRQEVSRVEIAILVVIIVAGVGSAASVATSHRPAVASVPLLSDPGAVLDTARYAVLPFPGSGALSEKFSPDLLLHDAFSRWRGIEVVDRFRTRDVVAADTTDSRTLETSRRLAAQLGAGRFLTGEVNRMGDGTARVYVALFDTRTGERLAERSVNWKGEGPPGAAVYRRMADAMLFPATADREEADGEAAEPEEPGTLAYRARVAYLAGRQAMERWDLETAIARFDTAVEIDPQYARAHLQRSYALSWRGERGPVVLTSAERAAEGRETLTSRESRLLQALVHLESRRYPEACDIYSALTDSNPRDFVAWYGLATCLGRDRLVVRDASSRSGWRFRSSYQQAMEAYIRAFALKPAVHRGFARDAFADLRLRLFTEMDNVRIGQSRAGDTIYFAAYPGLAGDTLVFEPFPASEFERRNPAVRPASHWSAVDYQRRQFRQLSEAWVSSFPRSADALEAYALSLDLLSDPAALDTLRSARSRELSEEQDRRLAIKEFFLIVKYSTPHAPSALERARLLADSLLDSQPTSSSPAGTLAAIAAITGRAGMAAALAHASAGPSPLPVPIPTAINGMTRALLAYASLGGPADSILEYERRVEGAVRNLVAPEDQEAARQHLLQRPATLAFPTSPLAATPELARASSYPPLVAQGAILMGDHAAARAAAGALKRAQASRRPADRTADVAFPEAWIHAAVGDTASAVATLDSLLSAIRWMGPGALGEVGRAGSLVRAMVLRAEIAAELGDHEVARQWARTVTTLWTAADPTLQPVVSRLRRLTRPVEPRM